MVSKTRKVSFYRLSLEKQTLLPGTRTVRVTQLNNSEIEDCFREIYNEKMQVLSDNHKAINITASRLQMDTMSLKQYPLKSIELS